MIDRKDTAVAIGPSLPLPCPRTSAFPRLRTQASPHAALEFVQRAVALHVPQGQGLHVHERRLLGADTTAPKVAAGGPDVHEALLRLLVRAAIQRPPIQHVPEGGHSPTPGGKPAPVAFIFEIHLPRDAMQGTMRRYL